MTILHTYDTKKLHQVYLLKHITLWHKCNLMYYLFLCLCTMWQLTVLPIL